MIQEASLYADLHVETSPVAATAVWTDHIATVRDVSLSRGGVEPFIGVNNVETGSGVISLINNIATIEPGYWVKVSYQTSIIWAGFIQDVNITYTFIDGVEYAVKNLVVLDWVAWISQWSFSEYAATGSTWTDRADNINLQIYPSGTNTPIIYNPIASAPSWSQSKIIGNMSVGDVLDLLSNSITNGFWKANLAVPTGSTSGIDSLVSIRNTSVGTAGTLIDGTETSSTLSDVNYVEVEMVKQTSQVTNNIIISNAFENEGEMLVVDYQKSDATSVASYGSRLATIETGITSATKKNLFPYASFEDYSARDDTTNFFYSAEQPALDSVGSWAAFDGDWAYRAFCKVAAVTTVTLPLVEQVPVTAGETYYGFGYGASSAGTLSRARFFIQYQDDAQATISTTYGSQVTHTALKTWYKSSVSVLAPAGAVYARVGLQFSRTSGANIGINSRYWADGIYFGITNEATWFDGNTPDTSSILYGWLGEPNKSASFYRTNYLDTLAGQFLTDNKDPKFAPISVRVNAQDKLSVTKTYDLYRTVNIWRDAHRWTSYITGINHEININADGTTRWMIDLVLQPSTYTI